MKDITDRADRRDATAMPFSGNPTERRQVTVVFCDLVQSTALSSVLDPEDLWDVLRGYREMVERTICDFGGIIAHPKGDGILCCFGFPAAHDDNAGRAVAASLALLEQIASGPRPGIPIRLRIGISTGEVAIIDNRNDHAVGLELLGSTPNLAARLQADAEENGVLVDDVTYRLTRHDFDYRAPVLASLKGFEVPIPARRPLAHRAVRMRFETRSGPTLQPFVNRQHELAEMNYRWDMVRVGRGQVVAVAGEPGIGKSRLVRTFCDRLPAGSHTVVKLQCSQMQTKTALHPFAGGLAPLIGIETPGRTDAKVRRLRQFLADLDIGDRYSVPLLAQMLGLSPLDDRLPALNELTPEDIHEKTTRLVTACLSRLASQRPLVCVFEDIHWADPTSLALLSDLGMTIDDQPVMIVATCRSMRTWHSDPLDGLRTRDHCSLLALERLSRPHSVEIASNVVGSAQAGGLSADWITRIVERSDGVPLFIEELTRNVLEHSPVRDADAANRNRSDGIPATLRASLAARLDSLASGGPARPSPKRIAQIGACIGREFTRDLLAALARAVTPQGDDLDAALADALEQLVRNELIYRTTAVIETYRFKHALLQDEAYGSLWREDRKRVHGHIVDLIEATPVGGIAGSQPELVAHHATQAGRQETAARHWLAAGKRAARRSSLKEARHHFETVLKLTDKIAAPQETRHLKLEAYVALGAVLMAEQGFAAPQVARLFDKATALGRHIGTHDDLYIPALLGRQLTLLVKGRHKAAVRIGMDCLELARQRGEPSYEIEAQRHLGASMFWYGRTRESRAHLAAVSELYDRAKHSDLSILYGSDPRAGALIFLSLAQGLLGQLEDADASSRQALKFAAELGHGHTQGYALLGRAMLLDLQRSPETSAAARAAMRFCRDHALPFWESWARVLHGHAQIRAGLGVVGLATARRGIEAFRATGAGVVQTYFHAILAEGHARSGEVAAARQELRAALTLARQNHEGMYVPELWRMMAVQSAAAGAEPVEVEAMFVRALRLTRRRGVLLLEGRTALSYAEWLAGRGRTSDARRIVVSSLDRCSLGQDTAGMAALRSFLSQAEGVPNMVLQKAHL